MASEITRRTFVGTVSAVALAAGAGLIGCGESRSGSVATGDAPDASAPAAAAGGKSLVVLWSWSGNTLAMAERVSELSGAEIHRIVAVDPYPGIDHYEACTDRAKRERDDGVYPEIANPVQNWTDYDTVFLGYPIWWYHLPMIVQGFVRDHDWAGKTIAPFNSHEGSGNGGTYADLREMTGATVLEGLAIRGANVPTSLDQVDTWYAGLGL